MNAPGIGSTAIVGSGAIGLYYGARLAAHGDDVRFLVRSDAGVIARDGIKVSSVHGDVAIPRPSAATTAAGIGPVDLVVVCWKATANDRLAEVLPPLMHEGTRVLTLQNGLGNCERLASIVGEERVLGALCFVCINRVGPGSVSHTAGGRVVIGDWRSGTGGYGSQVAGMWAAAGIQAEFTATLEQAQWEKLVWNIPFNGLAIAEGGVTTDVLLENPETLGEIRALMEEVVEAAGALGHRIDPSFIDFNINRTRPMGPYRPSSMIDFVEGRDVELDPIWAEPLRRAVDAGVEMPRVAELLGRIRRRIAERTPAGAGS